MDAFKPERVLLATIQSKHLVYTDDVAGLFSLTTVKPAVLVVSLHLTVCLKVSGLVVNLSRLHVQYFLKPTITPEACTPIKQLRAASIM